MKQTSYLGLDLPGDTEQKPKQGRFARWLDLYWPMIVIRLDSTRWITVELSKNTLWLWLKHNVMHVEEGSIMPWYALVLKCMFFPLDALARWVVNHQVALTYNGSFKTDTITIFGMRYSMVLFHAWSKHGIPIGRQFEIIKREDGLVTMEGMEFRWRKELPVGAVWRNEDGTFEQKQSDGSWKDVKS